MLTDFYVGRLSDAEEIVSGASSLRPRLSIRNADNAVLADLWAAIDPGADVAPLQGDACIVASRSEGPWVLALPAGLVDGLAAVTEGAIPAICERWCAGEEMAFHNVPEDVMRRPLVDLIEVASEAKNADHALLLWMSV